MDRTYEDALGFTSHERGGDAKAFGVSIDALQIGGGEPVQLPAVGITLVVGGNNAGKSTLLRQIQQVLLTQYGQPVLTPEVLRALTIAKRGTVADLLAWLGTRIHPVTSSTPGSLPSFNIFGVGLPKDLAAQIWSGTHMGGPAQLAQLGGVVAFLANARERFTQTSPLARRADFTQPPSGPLHRLEDSPALFNELSNYSQDVFGAGLTLDPLSGNLMLRFGHTDVPVPPVNAVTTEYRAALAALRPISEQGDGVASALGLLLPLVAGEYPIALVDEPEAFLHPPQAFKLGRALARISESRQSQLVLATHDRNLVSGALAEETAEITIIRLIRSGNDVVARQIAPQSLRQVWSSPALRHSAIIDGLFHRAVVIAENERDCVFYAAALEALDPLPADLSATDVLFLPSHGLGGMPELAKVLRAAAVPTVIAADLDAVSDEVRLQTVTAAVGGIWSERLKKAWTASTAEFRQPKPQLTHAQVLATLEAVLGDERDAVYTNEDRKKVGIALASESRWDPVKRYGMSAFQANRGAADDLLSALDEQGIVLAQVGELERFAPTVDVRKGASWVPAALAQQAEKNEESKRFIERLVDAIVLAEQRVATA